MSDRARRRWAGFAYGLDVLCFPPAAEGISLVREGSAEAAWAQRALPPEGVAAYRLEDDASPEDLETTAGVLHASDAAARLRAAGADRLLLSCSPAASIERWSQREKIGLLSPPGALARRLEDKLFFHRLLQSLDLPQPPGGPVAASAPPPADGYPWVLQIPDSLGGEGTFFLHSAQEWQANRAARAGQTLLARRFLRGRTYGVTLFVTEGAVQASALRVQAYLPSPAEAELQWFAGVQWVATRDLSSRSRDRLNRALETLGRWLHSQGYLGIANFDLLVDEAGDPFFLECNPRMSAATPQWLLQEETGGGPAAASTLLAAWAPDAPRPTGAAPRCAPIPDSNFLGAAVEVAPWLAGEDGALLRRAAPGGMYRVAEASGGPALAPAAAALDLTAGGEVFFLPVGDETAALPCTTSRGTALSRIPCFDPAGRALPLAPSIGRAFLTTVDRP